MRCASPTRCHQGGPARSTSDAPITVAERQRFVSRGGEKLAGALDDFGVDVAGLRVVDVGASTGGFTDCVLQRGAASVCAVDVGYGQLAWSLRTDARVTVFERTNIRAADPAELGAPFDLAVIDVSFISLRKVLPNLLSLIDAERRAACRAGKAAVRSSVRVAWENGVSSESRSCTKRCSRRPQTPATEAGLVVRGLTFSPIKGS